MWKKNHYAKMCLFKKKINTIFAVNKKEIYKLDNVHNMKKEQTITLITEWKTKIKFQMDTGANVNIIPKEEYVRITKDTKLQHIDKSTERNITTFGETQWPVLGERIIRVKRRKISILIRILVIEGRNFHSILSRQACIVLQCIKCLDSDEQMQVNICNNQETKEDIIQGEKK